MAFHTATTKTMMRLPVRCVGCFFLAILLGMTTVSAFSIHPRSILRTKTATITTQTTTATALSMSVPNSFDVLTSGLASIVCLPRGVTVSSLRLPQTKTKQDGWKISELYDVETSQACRTVREKITELDLVVPRVVPVAEGSSHALPSGTRSAPVLVASSRVGASLTGEDRKDTRVIEGAEAINAFLDETFAYPPNSSNNSEEGEDNLAMVREKLKLAGLYLADWMRLGRGSKVSPAVMGTVRRPSQPLVLYSYEGNQFCRLVREVLTELDVVYELRSAGKESPRRAELASINGGSSQCPYLIDPNTGVSMPESADICEYLYRTYAAYTPPSEVLGWVSTNVMSLAKPLFKVLAPQQAGASESDYPQRIEEAVRAIEARASSAPVVVYTYELSPFSSETTTLLDRLGVEYTEVSLGKEWLPGLIDAGEGAITRAALLELTGQSSLPHVFVDGKSIGGLYSGSPGLVPLLERGEFRAGSSSRFDTTDAFQ